MLVSIKPFGRLGNRLFLDAHLSAFCWKHSIELRNLALDGYRAAFPAMAEPTLSGWVWKLRSWAPGARHFRYWGEQDLDFDQTDLASLVVPLQEGRTVFFHAWKFRGFESVARFRERLLERYRPSAAVGLAVESVLGEARKKGERVVGVHIRWEDYRGTPWFLEATEYRLHMDRVVALLAPMKVSFVVFSNEAVPRGEFSGLEVSFAQGSPFEDLYSMAACDYLMGPPSTFSGWASFYGKVPLLTLGSGLSKIDGDSFHVVTG